MLVITIGLIIYQPITLLQKDKTACLSLTFDDGYASHYSTVLPLLKEKNYNATFFIILNSTAKPSYTPYMNEEQIQALASQGYEIGSHSINHPFLTNLSNEEIKKELKESKRQIEEKYNIKVTSFALPYGDYNDEILEEIKKYYISARTIYNLNSEDFLIRGLALTSDTTSEIVCQSIEHANKEKLWLVLIFHDISQNPLKWDTSTENFKEILQCAKNSNIKVDSITECKKALS